MFYFVASVPSFTMYRYMTALEGWHLHHAKALEKGIWWFQDMVYMYIVT